MFRIRNSMLTDWEEMPCKLAFKARWFGTDEEKKLMDIGDRDSIIWGSYFEQLVLGSGVGGKTLDLVELGRKNNKNYLGSVYYQRVKRQAAVAREFIFGYLKSQGYPFWKAQVQLVCDFEIEGEIIPYEGNADALLGLPNQPTLVLDTKFTGDTTNTWGKYSWGNPEAMDMGQLVGYMEASKLIYGTEPKAMYYVADSKEAERVEPIYVEYSKEYIDWYMIGRLKPAYEEINHSRLWNYWQPAPSYNNCNSCPLKNICTKAVKIPEIKTIQK